MNSLRRELFAYAIKLLSRRDYSKAELERKLRQKFPVEEKELLSVLEELVASGYVNELRAAVNYFQTKSERGWGRRKIRWKLKEKGFPESVIDEAELYAEFDYSVAVKHLERRFSPSGGKRERERARRFLLNRGFTYAETEKILKDFFSQC